MHKKPELLAPASDFECLEAAFNHGADAVYIGVGTYNLRANSPNFAIDEFSNVLEYGKRRKKRIYAVLNSMPNDSQLQEIDEYLVVLAEQQCMPHAFIVSDPGVIQLIKKRCGDVPLHLSTQTGSFNALSCQFWAKQGIRRVVLPRELNIKQIAALNHDAPCETEVFIHGAMCVSISGRCLLGAYMSKRHANHGDCPQPCRFKYAITPISKEESDEELSYVAEEDERGVYLLNAKDLNTLAILPQVVESGVSSLKIEGRNKSVHYVSAVVKTYRTALDCYLQNPTGFTLKQEWVDALDELDHREYTTGFYINDYVMQDPYASKIPSSLRVVGVVKALHEGGGAVVDVKNPFMAGEKLTILPVNRKKEWYTITIDRITDINGDDIDRAITNRIVVVNLRQKLAIGDILRRKLS